MNIDKNKEGFGLCPRAWGGDVPNNQKKAYWDLYTNQREACPIIPHLVRPGIASIEIYKSRSFFLLRGHPPSRYTFGYPLLQESCNCASINPITLPLKKEKEYRGLEPPYKLTRPNKHIQTIPLNNKHSSQVDMEHYLGWTICSTTSLKYFLKTEIIYSIFYHNGMKLEISNIRKNIKFTNVCKLNNTLFIGQKRNHKEN